VLSDKSTARDEAKIVPISKSLDANADSQPLSQNLVSSERMLWKELHPICNTVHYWLSRTHASFVTRSVSEEYTAFPDLLAHAFDVAPFGLGATPR
jgi:hypothetical protein